jgi:cytidine deaminase
MKSISEQDRIRLMRAAEQARNRSYAPYSKFQVGAAVLSEDGSVFTGCNIENSSYGLTICAERVALFKAVSEGSTHLTAVALATDSEKPAMPCGACRQVLTEFNPEMLVFSGTIQGKFLSRRLSKLLPEAFKFT